MPASGGAAAAVRSRAECADPDDGNDTCTTFQSPFGIRKAEEVLAGWERNPWKRDWTTVYTKAHQ